MASQTLVTRAVLRLDDQLSGGLSAVAKRVEGIHNRMMSAHAKWSGMLATAGVGFGLSRAIQQTEQFSEAMFGVGVASVTEAMDDLGNVSLDRMVGDMQKAYEISMRLSRELRYSPTAIGQIGEVLAKAGMKAEQLEDTMRAATTLAKADPATPGSRIADYLHTLSVIQKPRDGETFGMFMRREADMINAAAAETKLGVGSIMDGMRQFATIGSGMGLKSEDMLPMLMGMVQRGFGASESGTALKSMFVRLSKRTTEGQAVLKKFGIDLTSKEFSGGASLVNAQRAVSNLNNVLMQFGGLKGNDATRVKAMLSQAEAKGWTVEQATEQVMSFLLKSKKGVLPTDSAGQDRVRRIISGAIGTPEGNINVVEVLRRLLGESGGDVDKTIEKARAWASTSKSASDADLASLFRGEHLARMKALLESLKGGVKDPKTGKWSGSEFDQSRQLLERMKGQGLDAVEALWSKSAIGNLRAMQAAFERLNIVIANSPGIQRFVNWIERMADAISKADPMLIDLAARLALIGVVAGPVMLAAAALAKVGSVAWMAAKAVGALNAALFVMGARGLAAAGVAAAARGGLFGAIAGGAMMAGSRVLRLLGFLGRLTGIGVAVGAAWAVFEHWKTITAWFEKLGKSEGGKALLESWSKFWESLKGLGGDVVGAIGKLLDLLGFKSDATGVTKVLDQIIDLLTNLGAAAEKAVDWVRKLVNGDFGGALGGSWLDGLLERFNRTFGWLAPKPKVPPGTYDPYAPKQGPEAWDWDGKPRRAPLDKFDFLPPGMAPAFAGIENSNREVGTKVDALGGRVDASASAIVTAINAQAASIGNAVANAVAGAIPRGAKGPAAAPTPTLADGSGMGR